jgi:ATP-binding cassette subfamily F protein uup
MDMPAGKLSGGEQNRLLLARLLLKPENVLILDEPTNDLDFETLDVLREALIEHQGALILVSHDRFFMDQVCNRLIAQGDPSGRWTALADYYQWEEWHSRLGDPEITQSTSRQASVSEAPKPKPARLSYKDQRDWETIEDRIQKAEAAKSDLEARLNEPAISSQFEEVRHLSSEVANLQIEIDQLYRRWQELSDKRSGAP